AKQKLNLDNICTLLFIGSLEKNKKPNKLIEIMNSIDIEVNVIFLGVGTLYSELKDLNNKNIITPGYVNSNIELYLSASDIVIVPGRAGMNISESLAFGLPVIVHQADGIEYDLIKNGENGFIIPDDKIETYCFFIKEIMNENFEFTNDINYNANTMAMSMANGCKKALRL
ncbi:MAG: glycosyltransferase, partial [Candidatus Marinimicrobia bacterium]|nr:glycosyltransferase [Candidatus Neomarinimicrobiota bacterium]